MIDTNGYSKKWKKYLIFIDKVMSLQYDPMYTWYIIKITILGC